MENLSEKSPNEVLFESPLYAEFQFDDGEDGLKQLFEILYFNGKIDFFCPECKKEVPYKGTPIFPDDPANAFGQLSYFSKFKENKDLGHFYTQQNFCVRLKCLKGGEYYDEHKVEFWFKVEKNKLIKIGQFPSATTLEQFKNVKYKSILKDKFTELNRAIGLKNFNVGIGSFIYLRRIFEYLIEETKEENPQLIPVDWKTTKMEVKIDILKSVLPSYLVEKRKIYAIMSKGIHELSESDCLKYFSTVKLGIELILDQKIELKERQAKIKENSKEIDLILKEITQKV